MNKYYSDKEHVEIARKEYDGWEKGYEVKLNNDKPLGYISQINNKPTGEQSFVITDNYVPLSAPKKERESVKEITVLYRGSTGIDKIKEQTGDVYKDWVVNDSDMAHKISTSKQGKVSPQLTSSAETLKNVLKEYPNAQVSVYGHSLGSMNGQYAVSDLSIDDSKRIMGGYFFQGPNIYDTLTYSQRYIADSLTSLGKLNNYVDGKDLIPIGYGDGKPLVGRLIPLDSKKVGFTSQHMWGGYQYDVFGNVLLDTKDKVEMLEYEMKQRISGLEGLKSQFMVSGNGALSTAQEIFLDASEAKAITVGYKQSLQTEIDSLKKWFQTEITNANDLWQTSKSDAQYWGEHLDEYEELDALASEEVTKHSIVIEPVEEYEDSLFALKTLEEELDNVLKNIEKAIESQVILDEELAKYLF
ncbi:hypothetical protein HB802_10240 [Listeria welshimeri]|nr:hypothetical protein [Listeria welshimeri]MBC1347880.1 hypothetical protein [Listeria welshimeri]